MMNLGVGGIIKGAGEALDGLFTSAEERAKGKAILLEVEAKLAATMMDYEGKLVNAQRDLILAEINSQSWWTRNWRPMLMLVIIVIIANKYVIYPYFSMFGVGIPELVLPDMLWDVMKISLGGYIVGRSSEKIVEKLKATKSVNLETAKDTKQKRKLAKTMAKLGLDDA